MVDYTANYLGDGKFSDSIKIIFITVIIVINETFKNYSGIVDSCELFVVS